MPHYFIPSKSIVNGRFTVAGEEAHHLIDVRRVKPGDEINLFDGSGTNYTARVESVRDGELSGAIISETQSHVPAVKINLYQSVPKGERLDWLVEKAAELGVNSLVPIEAQRSIVKGISANKLDRWRRLSQAASKQCGRSDLMAVTDPMQLSDALQAVSGKALNIIPWESENAVSINGLKNEITSSQEVNIFIGPEGGFTLREIEGARSHGVIPVTLGARILRVETASLLSAVLVLAIVGEFDRNE
jgi:16S rRNA (uracil1498-N3)-methyltransferase